MWNGADAIEAEFFFRTRVGVERMTFTGVVRNFSLLSPGPKGALCAENPLISMNVSIIDRGKIELGIKAVEHEDVRLIKWQLFLLDAAGSRVQCGHKEFYEAPFRRLCRLLTWDRAWKIPLTLNKTELMLRKEQYLPNDVLTLQCEIACFTELDMGVIQDIKSTLNGVAEASSINEPGPSREGSLSTQTDDLVSLYHDPVCCDVRLRTGAETFPAHRVILSARSPVFRAMLDGHISGCVDVSDLKPDVVLRMLLFLYTDDLGEVHWDVARDLYVATVKYQLPSLRRKSALQLQEKLQTSNCCDVLVLADEHRDAELKTSAQQYIVKHSLEVFGTEAWRGLEKDCSRLTLEIFRIMCFRH